MRNKTKGSGLGRAAGRRTFLSRTGEHAIRAAVHLARQGEGVRIPASSVAEALGIPPNYLSKTLHAMTREGVLESRRGPEGGFALAMAPAELTLDRVVRSVDPPREARQCLLHAGACDPEDPCSLHDRWTAVEEGLRRPLWTTTVQDLLDSLASEPGASRSQKQ